MNSFTEIKPSLLYVIWCVQIPHVIQNYIHKHLDTLVVVLVLLFEWVVRVFNEGWENIKKKGR